MTADERQAEYARACREQALRREGYVRRYLTGAYVLMGGGPSNKQAAQAAALSEFPDPPKPRRRRELYICGAMRRLSADGTCIEYDAGSEWCEMGFTVEDIRSLADLVADPDEPEEDA